jgi:nucleoside-diphosphate-sugar epimerase
LAFTTISADDRRLKRKTQEAAIFELAKKVKETTKCKSTIEFHPLPKDDPKRRCPDTSKLERLVGWKPRVSFEEELKRTVAWFSSKLRKENR